MICIILVFEPIVYLLGRTKKLLTVQNLLNKDLHTSAKLVLNQMEDAVLVLDGETKNEMFKNQAATKLLPYERFEQFGFSPLESREFRPLDNDGIVLASTMRQTYLKLSQIVEHFGNCGKRFMLRQVTPQNIFNQK